ncbi:unnamed protein product [Peniophora sp. CBMAI 1063]|nr:unnamed protein product [Peniophora sp. CBMAI 1063]
MATFERLELEVDYNDNVLKQTFRRGLDLALCKKIDNMPDRLQTIDEWKETALDKDEAMQAECEEEKAWLGSSFHKLAAPQAPKKDVSSATPVQPIVWVQAYTKLTEAEKDRLIASNGCFYCGQDGHMVENCPNRKKRSEKGDSELLARLLVLGAEEKAKLKESLKNF